MYYQNESFDALMRMGFDIANLKTNIEQLKKSDQIK